MKFQCLKCKNDTIQEVQCDLTALIKIHIDEDEIDYSDEIDYHGGYVMGFQCSKCGKMIKDNNNCILTDLEKIKEWLLQQPYNDSSS